jgi:alpha-N-arabinofuranosidase
MTLDLRGALVGEPTARLLTADKLQDHNTPEAPTAVAPRPFDGVTVTERGWNLTLPPHSFITVQAPVTLAG